MAKQFVMSMFATRTDLLEAKAKYYQEELEAALLALAELVEFTEVPEVKKVVDGAFDPAATVERARRLILCHNQALLSKELAERA